MSNNLSERAVIALEIIAAAQVAQALTLAKFGASSQSTVRDKSTASTVRVQEAITRYLQMYQAFITQKHTGKNGSWITDVRGDVRARYTVEADKTITLCLPVKQFQKWALERNIDINHIRQWAKENGITQKQVRIAPDKTNAVSCFLIPGDNKTK